MRCCDCHWMRQLAQPLEPTSPYNTGYCWRFPKRQEVCGADECGEWRQAGENVVNERRQRAISDLCNPCLSARAYRACGDYRYLMDEFWHNLRRFYAAYGVP